MNPLICAYKKGYAVSVLESKVRDREYPDLCILPELTEQTLLDNLKGRFASGHIYFVNKQSNINETITNKQQTLSALPSAFILLLFSS
ncbi:hypothetical protein WUBG_04164 [Wuchereria bancrofti]|uniref:Uncharacterized protein n=1 Tax=Wuchereria bancrofti TaxID=6293 RepID=J9EQV7_WUCBA|nr:hypothetical protein WUBG_04164 [Wuchereria bancrofti]